MLVKSVGVMLPVDDLAAAEAFYSGELGMERVFWDAGVLVLEGDGGGRLVLVHDVEKKTHEVSLRTSALRGVLLVSQCPRVARRLEELGLTVFPREEPSWGGLFIDFIDPFGNRLSLYSAGG
ncbi:MAG: VOC family protein, partial [Burkholderiales bacterium]|nr:VOC family protein [Burkholderiales bacterium]